MSPNVKPTDQLRSRRPKLRHPSSLLYVYFGCYYSSDPNLEIASLVLWCLVSYSHQNRIHNKNHTTCPSTGQRHIQGRVATAMPECRNGVTATTNDRDAYKNNKIGAHGHEETAANSEVGGS